MSLAVQREAFAVYSVEAVVIAVSVKRRIRALATHVPTLLSLATATMVQVSAVLGRSECVILLRAMGVFL